MDCAAADGRMDSISKSPVGLLLLRTFSLADKRSSGRRMIDWPIGVTAASRDATSPPPGRPANLSPVDGEGVTN